MYIYADGSGFLGTYCQRHGTSFCSSKNICCSGLACDATDDRLWRRRSNSRFLGVPLRTGVENNRIPSVISPIAHVPLADSCGIPAPHSMASDNSDRDYRLLASLLNRSSFRSMSRDSVMSESTFYCATDSLAGSSVPIPDWRLNREGPVMAQIPHPRIGDSRDGCAFRCTTYMDSDFAHPSGEYGSPLHHPRFVEWVGAPESTRLLDRGPGAWLRSLSHAQSIDTAHPVTTGCMPHDV